MHKIDKLIFASSNQGKIAEINHILKEHVKEIISQKTLGIQDIEETGTTFVENALLKAKNACNYANITTIADDSGLIVDELQGEPGLYSARYAGKNVDFNLHIEKVLKKLKDIPFEKRNATFYSVIVLMHYKNDPMPKIFEGKWHGKITFAKKGQNGYGYDPIFFVPDLNLTAAEINKEQKNKISHRAQALAKLIAYLDKNN